MSTATPSAAGGLIVPPGGSPHGLTGVGGGLPLGGKDRDDSTDEAESAQLLQTAGMEPASRHAHVVVH